jgi:DNA-directed RNA polymerase subunit RPC12/RpoP
MPILIQCTSCQRKLRVQDTLLGKYVKCPNCRTKFQVRPLEAPPAEPTQVSLPPVPASIEELQQTPVVPPIGPPDNPELSNPQVQILELTEPASSPSQAAPQASSKKRVAVAAAAPPAPAPPAPPPKPPPFPTPALKVFAVLTAIVFLTLILGLGFSWVIAGAVERAVDARQAQ